MSVLFLSGAGAKAQDSAFSADDFFHSGLREAALDGGAMFSPVGAVGGRPTLNYTLNDLQFGWMLSDVRESWLRGNCELSADILGGGVFDGKGSYLAGGTLWLRYNFVPPQGRFVPFAQLGAGALATDINTRLVGQTFNFNLDFGVGVRWFVAQNWSLNLECRYQHISNARLANHDLGVNAVGPVLGISYFF